LCGRLFEAQNRSGLGGIEGNTCLMEGWLGHRNVRGLVELKEIPVVWKAVWGPEPFGAWWNRRKYMSYGRLVGPQKRSGLGGIEGNTCCVEGCLGPRTVRGLVESKEIHVLWKAGWAPETFGAWWN